jgi:hypothetical protein
MLPALSACRQWSALTALGGLFIIICTTTAEAGITLSGGGYKGTGDPKAHYDLFAYLDAGSKLVKGTTFDKDDFFTLNKLFGIKGAADYTFNTPDKKQQWGAAFGLISHPDLKIGSTDYGKVAATDVTFFYEGPAISNPVGAAPLLLGEVKIWEDDYHNMPVLPGGSQISITYDYMTKDSKGKNIPFTFTVVPEPSSLVIVTLVGSCVAGLALVRNRRRAA